ncbi:MULTISPECIES: hypothetical protein [Mycobacteriaceae]|uniref:Uncharacterized protein n=1 Tax=Mycolicibacterium parafortuitum TaxID=39692 RepID=A0ACC6MP32_MYCPF|nr:MULTISPECIES: hypothetical protein [Mycobacteriaceae]MDZ5088719.1 hypothetical protein [Mycolicibacterium parafortuitum]GFM18349.1 uncharacterized protein PO1_contig-026-37 [Mycobacterium sp. PO1]GFM24369.1 uncharacterized protein PO2_contig-037-37 [Mycobacterium sp. PO2]
MGDESADAIPDRVVAQEETDEAEHYVEPWEEDPAAQLQEVVEPGRIELTLWTAALGGDPVAHDVSFKWSGGTTADWYEDISSTTEGLSVMSSSPVRGVMAWPDGKDVMLTFTWSDLELEGHAVLPEMAPTLGGDPTHPKAWLHLAEALLQFVLLDLGSGSRRSTPYYDADGWSVDIDDLLREFLSGNGAGKASEDFQTWLDDRVAAGKYTIEQQ